MTCHLVSEITQVWLFLESSMCEMAKSANWLSGAEFAKRINNGEVNFSRVGGSIWNFG